MPNFLGTHDVLFITLDTLRYDVARDELAAGRTPHLAQMVGAWEERHTPASFTFAAHQAFFAGFLPTPTAPGKHPRRFATRFPGSETTTAQTIVFDAPDIVAGLADAGYHTVCIGGTGFFNKQSPLGCVLPSMFHESHWNPGMGVTAPESTARQVEFARAVIERTDTDQRLFLFINVSALHQPNYFYVPGKSVDSIETHAAALRYVDRALGPLFDALRRPTFGVICADHGTAYGEDGYTGHRVGHPVVWTVPYAEYEVT